MQPFAFCNRCRGMKVSWNRRYILHCLICLEGFAKSTKILALTILLSSFVFAFPVSTGLAPVPEAAARQTVDEPENTARDIEQAASLEKMLAPYGPNPARLGRVVRAIMASSKKYKVDPRLIASIVIVESGTNPFAVSGADSVGIMQIHLGTWGEIADKENVNLFKIEDNVDFGVRILRDYIADTNLWEGVARYRGKTDDPESQQGAQEYVEKVQGIYEASPKT